MIKTLLFVAYIATMFLKENAVDVSDSSVLIFFIQKIPLEMEVAPRYELLVHCLHCYTVCTVKIAFTTHTVNTAYIIKTALHYFNSSMYRSTGISQLRAGNIWS